MRRITHLPKARWDLSAYVRRLEATDAQSWPPLLCTAWGIAKELSEPDHARQTVLETVRAAHACCCALSARLQANAGRRPLQAVLKAAKRIAPHTKRMPAAARRALDEIARREAPSDRESLSTFLNGCFHALASFPDDVRAIEVRALLAGEYDEVPRDEVPIDDWPMRAAEAVEAMFPLDWCLVEDGLSRLLRDRSCSPSAVDVYSTIAAALKTRPIVRVGDAYGVYVAQVAEIWWRAGLEPRRSHLCGKPGHKSRFHNFLELVLRDHLVLGHLSKNALPENRYAWLISDKDLKAALATHLQKPS
jgi:hypothetical protein